MSENGLVKKLVSFFSFEHDQEDGEPEEQATSFREKIEKVVPMTKRSRIAQISIVSPQTFDDSQKVADGLKEGRAIIMNLSKLDVDLSKRIVDFVSGIVYALEGDSKKVGENIFVFSPANIQLSIGDNEQNDRHSTGFFFEER